MNPHPIEILEYLGIDQPSELSRRCFLELFGSGIVVAVSVPGAFAQEAARPSLRRELPDDFNAFLEISEGERGDAGGLRPDAEVRSWEVGIRSSEFGYL